MRLQKCDKKPKKCDSLKNATAISEPFIFLYSFYKDYVSLQMCKNTNSPLRELSRLIIKIKLE